MKKTIIREKKLTQHSMKINEQQLNKSQTIELVLMKLYHKQLKLLWNFTIHKSQNIDISGYSVKLRSISMNAIVLFCRHLNEPSHEKTNKMSFRPGLSQTGPYSHRSRLEA